MNPNKLNKLKDVVSLIVEAEGRIAKTRLLKLLFIIDRESVKQFGLKVTGLAYRLWQMGPVQFDVYENLSFHNGGFFTDVLKVKYDQEKCILVRGEYETEKSNLSKREIDLIVNILTQHRVTITNDLIKGLHEPGSLWRKVAEENGLYEQLENGDLRTTSVEIEFDSLISESDILSRIYQDAKEQEEIENLLS